MDHASVVDFDGFGGLDLSLAVSAGRCETPPPSKRPPNLVLIMADDLGIECLGCYGGQSYRTPRLDALARQGIRFTRCYSNPVCSPTRVALMTGQYNWRNYRGWGVFDPQRERTFGHLLGEAGYAVALAGKWQFDDLAKSPHHIRDSGFPEYVAWTWVFGGKKTDRYWNPSLWHDGQPLQLAADSYGPDVENEFLREFIARHKDRPFLIYYPMNLVHEPFHLPPASKGKPPFAAMVEHMDLLVGRLIDALDEHGLREQTLVLFTGDNGTPQAVESVFQGRMIQGGKGRLHDTGSHVPLIASWPGVASAAVRDDLIDFTDFLPTLLEAAGVALPSDRPLDGRSFLPQIRGEPGRPRQWILVENLPARFAMNQRFKLDHQGNLYDIANVPFEEPRIEPGQESPAAAAARRQLAEVLAKRPVKRDRPQAAGQQ